MLVTPIKPKLELIDFFSAHNDLLIPLNTWNDLQSAVGVNHNVLDELNTYDV